jgi:hypothetical protein
MREFLSDGMDSVDGPALDEPEDEDFGEDFEDEFDEEPEQEFGGPTMKM